MADEDTDEAAPILFVIDGEQGKTLTHFMDEREAIEAIPDFVFNARKMGEAMVALGMNQASSELLIFCRVPGNPMLEKALFAEMVRCGEDLLFASMWGEKRCPALVDFLVKRRNAR